MPEPTNTPEQKDSSGKPLSAGETKENLTSFAAFLRQNTNSDLADRLLTVATAIEVKEAMEEEEAPDEEHFPEWAGGIEGVEKVFVEPSLQMQSWQPVVVKQGRDKNDEQYVEIGYAKPDSGIQLRPGSHRQEHGVDLDLVENRFTVDEWDYIAKPILERYVRMLELRRLAGLPKSELGSSENKIKRMLPQVFYAGEIPDTTDLSSAEFRKQISELFHTTQTDPKVLGGWIHEILEGAEPFKITPTPYGDKKAKKEGDRFSPSNKGRALDRIKKQENKDIEKALAEKISRLGKQLYILNAKYPEGLISPKQIKPDFVETPHVKDILHGLSERVITQLREKKGMVSIVGDMGTGKNYIVEHFASKTHRPFFYFPCSRSMEAADLGFHFEYKGGETVQVPSALARGLKTRNAVILIDEPNALNPQVIASLHGLADHNRSFVYNGVEFKAAEGVCIVMTMNPATYAHVKSMPEAMADRSLGQDMYLDYPPLTKLDQRAEENFWDESQKQQALAEDNTLDKEFVCDEALILKNVFPGLKAWSNEDFTRLWNAVVNGAEGQINELDQAQQTLVNDTLRRDVKIILAILQICRVWRSKYRKKEMSRTISIRGSIAVAKNYIETGDVKKAFLSLYKPKAFQYDGGDQDYDSLEQIMNDQDELLKTLNDIAGV